MSPLVSWVKQGKIAILRFSNSPANVVNVEFLFDLNLCLKEIELEKSVEAIVVMSTSEITFATSELERGDHADGSLKSQLLEKAVQTMKEQSFPSIAIISGYATGEGFEMALACDYRVATKSARFGFSNGAIRTKDSEATLKSLIGYEKAKEVRVFRQIYGGIEAKKIGIVDQLISAPPLFNEEIVVEKFVNNQLGKMIKAGKRFKQSSSKKNELIKEI
ncbi:enoyl-CoA hydratase/isomerase family protein [Neobacillus sp. NRS-1170]|uniref:enoyl-CoA hydratase/isomerase family protein n=1 Tax=Neobacillus sp. NRS-1170 TaxID=3233898 RepID=UPI003D2A9208